MLLLTSTSDLLQIVTGDAVPVDVHASWVDKDSASPPVITPGRTNTAITTATTTTVVTSPAASTQRNVQTLNVHNKDASSSTLITVLHTDGTTAVDVVAYTLLAGETLQYVDGEGWRVINANGQIRTETGAAGGMSTHGSAYHSGNIFPGDVNQLLGSAYLEFATTSAPAGSANRVQLFAQKKFTETDLFYVDADGTVIALAQDNIITARNTSGSTITRGSVVYVSGASANLPKVDLAQADTDATMPAIGVAFEDISNNSNGRVMTFGVLENIDTSGFVAGDRLLVDPAVAGGLTSTQPTWPDVVQRVAIAIVIDASVGKLLIVPTGQRGDIGIQAVSAGTSNFLGQQLVINDSNGISFGLNGSTLTATVKTDYQTSGAYLTTQSGQAFSADASSTFQTLTLQNSNGVSFSNNAGAVRITHDLMFSTSRPAFSAGAASSTFQTLTFQDSNGISFSNNAGAIRASHNALTSQSNQAFSADASSTFQTLTFQNSNQISFSNNAGAIRITHDLMQSTSRPAFSADASSTFQTLSFQNSNQISFSNNAGAIRLTHQLAGTSTGFAGANISGSITHNTSGINLSLSVAAPGAAAENNWFNLLGANTAGDTTASGSTIGLSGLGVTLSGTNGSVIVVSGGGGGGGFTAPGFNPYDDHVQVVGQVGQGSLLLDPQILPNVSFDRIVMIIQNTNSSNSSGSHTLNFAVGLYTRNVSTLSRYTSFSGTTALTHSGTAGSYSWYSGQRGLAFTFGATSISEGKYWIGFVSSTQSAGNNGSYSMNLASNINSQYTGSFGQASNATMQPKLGQGYYTAATSQMPASIAFSHINGTVSGAKRFPVIGFGSGTV